MARARWNNSLANTDYIMGGNAITGMGGTKMMLGGDVVWPAGEAYDPNDGSALVAFFRALASVHNPGFWVDFQNDRLPPEHYSGFGSKDPNLASLTPHISNEFMRIDGQAKMLIGTTEVSPWELDGTEHEAVFSARVVFDPNYTQSQRNDLIPLIHLAHDGGDPSYAVGLTLDTRISRRAVRITAEEAGVTTQKRDQYRRGTMPQLPESDVVIVADSTNWHWREAGTQTWQSGAWQNLQRPLWTGLTSLGKTLSSVRIGLGEDMKCQVWGALALADPQPGMVDVVKGIWDVYGV